MAAFPDNVQDMEYLRFHQGPYDNGFIYAGGRFLGRAEPARQERDAQIGDGCLNHEIALARLKDDLRLEPDFFTVCNDLVVQIEIVPIQDERLIGQFFQGNGFFLAERIVAVNDHVHRILVEKKRLEIFFLRLRANDA